MALCTEGPREPVSARAERTRRAPRLDAPAEGQPEAPALGASRLPPGRVSLTCAPWMESQLYHFTGYVTLSKSLYLPKPQFAHL